METLHAYFMALLEAAETKNQQQFLDADKAVQAALVSAEKAVTKAEINADKWRANANEWREAMADREIKFMPRTEHTADQQALMQRLSTIEKRVADLDSKLAASISKGAGLNQAWSYLLGVIALIVALLSIYKH